jgi:hypothetical protein
MYKTPPRTSSAPSPIRNILASQFIAATTEPGFKPMPADSFLALRNWRGLRALKVRRCLMSKETPTDDPRQKTDGGSLRQTDKPWKGPPEKEQKPSDHTPDLEKWQETHTH